jgi:hypothetical protein
LARAAATLETERIKGSILDVYDDDDDDDDYDDLLGCGVYLAMQHRSVFRYNVSLHCIVSPTICCGEQPYVQSPIV